MRGHTAWSAEAELTGGLDFIVNVLITMGENRGVTYLPLLSSQKIACVTTGMNGVTLALAAKQFPLGLTVDNHHVRIQQHKGAHHGGVKLEPLLR